MKANRRRIQLPVVGIATERWTSDSETIESSRESPRRQRIGHGCPPVALDQHALEPFAPGDQPPAAHVELEHVLERAHLAHPHRGAGHQPGLLPSRHAPPVGVADLAHRGARARRQRRERHQRALRAGARARSGIGWPWGSSLRVADQPVDRLEHAVADVVLEHLGVLVHLRPIEAQHPHQEGLEDAMAAHHLRAPRGGRAAVSRAPAPGRVQRPGRRRASRRSMLVTEGAETPSRAASAEVGTDGSVAAQGVERLE